MRKESWIKLDVLKEPGMRRVLEALGGKCRESPSAPTGVAATAPSSLPGQQEWRPQ